MERPASSSLSNRTRPIASKSRERRSVKPLGASVRLMIRVVSSLRQITGFRVMGTSGLWTKLQPPSVPERRPQERGTGAGSGPPQNVAIIADIAGPAPHESPGKGGGREGSEDGQIDLGMPDVGWHGDSPLGWGATDRTRQNTPRQSGSPACLVTLSSHALQRDLMKIAGTPHACCAVSPTEFDRGCPRILPGTVHASCIWPAPRL